MKLREIIVITLGLLIIVASIYGIILTVISSKICEEECERRGYDYSEMKPSGSWDTNDWCNCYEKVERFRNG